VEQQLFSAVDWVMAEFLNIENARIKEKIAKYEEMRSLFKTEIRRVKHVDVPLKRNQEYLAALS
jgi:dynactin complex subunit